jgi:hypothetical protein
MGILDVATIFGSSELGIGAISPKMVKPQLEGDKKEDLVFTMFVGDTGA